MNIMLRAQTAHMLYGPQHSFVAQLRSTSSGDHLRRNLGFQPRCLLFRAEMPTSSNADFTGVLISLSNQFRILRWLTQYCLAASGWQKKGAKT